MMGDAQDNTSQTESAEGIDKDVNGKFDESELDGYITVHNQIALDIVNALRSNDRTARLDAATKLYHLVDKRETTAIQAIIDSGIVCDIVSMVSLDDVDLHSHLIAVLGKMVAGSSEPTSAVVEQGAIPKFILIASSSPSDQARADALLALGNIGADSPDLRDKLIQEGAVETLLEILNDPSEHPGRHLHGAANAIQSITYLLNPDSAEYDMTWDIIPVLTKYIEYETDETAESLEASLWALNYILSAKFTVEAVLHSDIVPRLVQLSTAKHAPTRRPVLRCVGRIIASSANGTEQLVAAGIIEAIRPCITAEDRLERRAATWVVLNIAVGTFEQAKALMAAGLVTPLVHIVSNTEEGSATRGNAARALARLTCGRGQFHHEIMETLFQATCLDGLLSALDLEERDVILASLKGIEVFVSRWCSGRQRAIEMLKTGNRVALLRAFKLRPEPDLAVQRFFLHKILKGHIGEFSLPPRV